MPFIYTTNSITLLKLSKCLKKYLINVYIKMNGKNKITTTLAQRPQCFTSNGNTCERVRNPLFVRTLLCKYLSCHPPWRTCKQVFGLLDFLLNKPWCMTKIHEPVYRIGLKILSEERVMIIIGILTWIFWVNTGMFRLEFFFSLEKIYFYWLQTYHLKKYKVNRNKLF